MSNDWKKDLKTRKKNLTGLFSDPNTRPIVFIMGGIVAGSILVGYMTLTKANSGDVDAASNIATKDLNIKTDPSMSASAEHARLQDLENQRSLELAKKNNESSLPSLIGNQGVNDPLSLPMGKSEDVKSVSQTLGAVDVSLPPPPPPPVQPQPVQAAPVQAQVQVVRQADPKLLEQMNAYLNMWGPRNNVVQEFPYSRTYDAQKAAQDAALAQNSSQSQTTQLTSNEDVSGYRFVRPGTVIKATLITPLNSDNPGPVMAQINEGPLAGSRILGTMVVQKDTIAVRFNTISKPGWPDSYTIQAVGMNDDGYTGLATDVNRHYMARYSALFAGTFLRGYGQGLSQQGSTTYVTEGGALVQDQDTLNSEEIRNKGYGEVATTLGSEIVRSSRRDTTIEVKGKAGAPYSFQVLFLKGF